jgi:hypothetical protein
MIFSELIKRVKTRGNGSWISKKKKKKHCKNFNLPPPLPGPQY